MQHTFTTHQIMNITTSRLYTQMDDIYIFFGTVIENGIMTHMLPNAHTAILPIMERKFPKVDYPHLWTKDFKPETPNDTETFDFTEDDKKEFWQSYKQLPSPLAKFINS